MLILAEIFNDSESGYWNHGIFVLRGIMGDYYWYPLHQLEHESAEKFDISCVLKKADEEICQIEDVEGRFGFTAYGYKFEPGDLQK